VPGPAHGYARDTAVNLFGELAEAIERHFELQRSKTELCYSQAGVKVLYNLIT